jgi:hypothetical protein
LKDLPPEVQEAIDLMCENYKLCGKHSVTKVGPAQNEVSLVFSKYLGLFIKYMQSPSSMPEFNSITSIIPDVSEVPLVIAVFTTDFTNWKCLNVTQPVILGRMMPNTPAKSDFVGLSSQVVSRNHVELLFSQGTVRLSYKRLFSFQYAILEVTVARF